MKNTKTNCPICGSSVTLYDGGENKASFYIPVYSDARMRSLRFILDGALTKNGKEE